jgi:uncharacterized protein YuzE
MESQEIKPGVILDYDNKGNVAGIEVLSVGKRSNKGYSGKTRK